ncbi:MAG: hypothetical protein ACKO9H_12840, partial [Planctomycetota bacterium]
HPPDHLLPKSQCYGERSWSRYKGLRVAGGLRDFREFKQLYTRFTAKIICRSGEKQAHLYRYFEGLEKAAGFDL